MNQYNETMREKQQARKNEQKIDKTKKNESESYTHITLKTKRREKKCKKV